jgi:hypothetical protein
MIFQYDWWNILSIFHIPFILQIPTMSTLCFSTQKKGATDSKTFWVYAAGKLGLEDTENGIWIRSSAPDESNCKDGQQEQEEKDDIIINCKDDNKVDEVTSSSNNCDLAPTSEKPAASSSNNSDEAGEKSEQTSNRNALQQPVVVAPSGEAANRSSSSSSSLSSSSAAAASKKEDHDKTTSNKSSQYHADETNQLTAVANASPSKDAASTPKKEKEEVDDCEGLILLYPEDREIATPYLFLLLSHVDLVHLEDSERVGNRKSLPVGLPGLACRHCNRSGRRGLCRVFPARRRGLQVKLDDLSEHLKKCNLCPPDVKSQLDRLKSRHGNLAQKISREERGFLEELWTRMGNTGR